MTLNALSIHVEAWLQEELGAQRTLLGSLERIETAALHGEAAEIERHGKELEGLLGGAGTRTLRRNQLLEKLGQQLCVPPAEVALSNLSRRLVEARVDTRRLDAMREELRGVVAGVLRAGRRLSALARYHRGVLEELCQLLSAEAPGRDGHLVDARG